MFEHSRGINTYDNCPDQRTASSFDEFCEAISNDLSPTKGLAYICSALKQSIHHDAPDKHQGINHWRLKINALPRRFLAFDLDGFSTPQVFAHLCNYLKTRIV